MRRSQLVLLVSVIAATPISATPTSPDKLELAQCFEAQTKVMPFLGIFAASDGHQLFMRATGHADGAGKVPITARTTFDLASVQKILTRVAIGQLVDKGSISFEAPVGTYVKGLPSPMAAATIEQLLRHRAGVAPLGIFTDAQARILDHARTAHDLLPLITSQPLSFPPGEGEEYSNGGYFLLGVVIEAVSRKDYATYMRRSVFTPLGMTSTSLAADKWTAVPFTKLAPDGSILQEWRALDHPSTRGNPAGGGFSSAGDMLKLGRALSGDRLLSQATKRRLFPVKSTPWRIGQAGGSIGSNTDFATFPDIGWTVVTLSNTDPPAAELMGEVMRTMVSTKACRPLSPKDRSSPFEQLAGPPKK